MSPNFFSNNITQPLFLPWAEDPLFFIHIPKSESESADSQRLQRIDDSIIAGETASFKGICRLLLLMTSIKTRAEETWISFLSKRLDSMTRLLAQLSLDVEKNSL